VEFLVASIYERGERLESRDETFLYKVQSAKMFDSRLTKLRRSGMSVAQGVSPGKEEQFRYIFLAAGSSRSKIACRQKQGRLVGEARD
jgi:hypothetical protein